jgi:hypothetical protein
LNNVVKKESILKDSYIKSVMKNSAQINYRGSKGKMMEVTNSTLLNVLETSPICTSCEAIALNCSVEICKNSSISGIARVINVSGDPLEYEILNYPSKGYVSIDSNTGIWRYTAKVGLTGLDEFTIRITTISGNEINSVISINLLDSICCQCRNKINTCVTIM